MNAYLVACDMFVSGYNNHSMRRIVIVAKNEEDAYEMAKSFWNKVKNDSNSSFDFDNFEATLLNYGEFMLDNGNFFLPYYKNGKIVNFDEFTINEFKIKENNKINEED